jgi:hypothetical protein
MEETTTTQEISDKEIIRELQEEIKAMKKSQKQSYEELNKTYRRKNETLERQFTAKSGMYKREYEEKEEDLLKREEDFRNRTKGMEHEREILIVAKKKLNMEVANLDPIKKEEFEVYLKHLFNEIGESMDMEKEFIELSEADRRIKNFETKLLGEEPAKGFNPKAIDLAYADTTTPEQQDLVLVTCISLPDNELRKNEIIRMMSFIKYVLCKDFQVGYEQFLEKYLLFLEKWEATIIEDWKKRAPLLKFEHLVKVRGVYPLKDKKGNPIEDVEKKIKEEIEQHMASDPHHQLITRTEMGKYTPFTMRPELYGEVEGIESSTIIDDPTQTYNLILAGREKQKANIKKSFNEKVLNVYRGASSKTKESKEYELRKKKALLEGREFTEAKPVIVMDPKRELEDLFLLDKGVKDITFKGDEEEEEEKPTKMEEKGAGIED